MIIGIEGTGSQEWSDQDLRRSFVRRVLEQSNIRPKAYFIGPNNPASDSAAIRTGAWWALKYDWSDPVVLVGYSRGAAYCLDLCLRFNREFQGQRQIYALVLFDAVRRDLACDLPFADDIPLPECVRFCLHAYRDPRSGSRYFFSNVQPRIDRGQAHPPLIVKRMFRGSHGALGGTFWDAAKGEAGFQTLAANTAVWASTPQSRPFVNPVVHAAASTLIGPYDRNLVVAPHSAITNENQDRQASQEVAQWVWPILMSWGVLPRGAQPLNEAKTFNGSKTPGQANPVQ